MYAYYIDKCLIKVFIQQEKYELPLLSVSDDGWHKCRDETLDTEGARMGDFLSSFIGFFFSNRICSVWILLSKASNVRSLESVAIDNYLHKIWKRKIVNDGKDQKIIAH